MIKKSLGLFAAPIFEGDEEKTRTASLLNVIALSSLLAALFYLPFAPVERILYIVPAIGVILTVWLVMKRGFVHIASIVMVTGISAVFLVSTFTNGGVQAPEFSGLMILILFAGILLGWKAAVGIMILCILYGMALLGVDSLGLLPAPPVFTKTYYWIIKSIFFVMAGVMLTLSLKLVNDAFSRFHRELEERKRAEQQVIRMERLYATLSQVNQIIVRVKSQQELFESICRVAVEFGQFAIAWVGLLEEASGEIRPVAATGLEVTKWPLPMFNVNHGDYAHGLPDTAIRLSRVITNEDIQASSTKRHHEDLAKRGYHSLAAVPVQRGDKTIGVLSLVSGEVGLFKAEKEIRLLEEMGLDISFALDMMERETARRQAEAEILSLSKFPDENPSPVMRVSQNGMILYANSASEDLLKTWERNVGEKVTDEWIEYIQQALEAGERTEVEIESSGKDYSCILSPVQSAGYINIYCYNITKRKLAEAELGASEERFRLLFENNHTIMMLIDPVSGAIKNANAAAAEFYGYPLSELCTMNIGEINPLTPDELYAERMRALKVEKNYFNFQHRLSDGEIRSVEVHSAPLEVNGNPFLFSIVYDITERKKAEEQIQRQLKYLSALRMIDIAISSSFSLRTILDVVLQQVLSQLEVDASAVLLFNSETQTIEYAAQRGFRSDALQYTKLRLGEGYAGRAVLERKTIHMTNLAETGSQLAQALQLEHEAFIDYCGTPLIVKGEVKGVLELFHRSRLQTDPEWLGFVEALAGQAAIAIDNAQLWEQVQRHAQELEVRVAERTADLNRANTELEHANRAKDEFLANMSHELRTPLNSILGLSESLLEQRRDPLNERQQKSLHIIEASGHHLLDLINDILDLSKVEAGMLDHYPQIVDVDALCRSSLSFVKEQAIRKLIALAYDEERVVSKIRADPRRLKQILVNLLTNAVKFTPERGQVTLQVKADPERDLISFSVTDTGIGIASENLKQLFQPFVQVDTGLNRQFEGTGLGLALVQKLTDMHGGSVLVESEVGVGSRFTIQLPWEQDVVDEQESSTLRGKSSTAEGSEKIRKSTEGSIDRGTILLAEDNMANILTIGEYLESHGYKLVYAHDGLEAIEKTEESCPNVILMDIQMPAMDGLEATRRLRANLRFATTPIIALTALAMPGDRERCLQAGANEYLSKPVSLKRLLKTIENLSRSHH